MVKRILALSLLMVVMSACGGQEDHAGESLPVHANVVDGTDPTSVWVSRGGVGDECDPDNDTCATSGTKCTFYHGGGSDETTRFKFYCLAN